MAGGVALVYLDIDDEITSAASRIRAADEVRVALVVPSGSRLATSRINFRLLAREAQSRSRQLLIVAPDGATRSLAASAGLTVYATVRELEEAFAPSPDSTGLEPTGAFVPPLAPPTDAPPPTTGSPSAAVESPAAVPPAAVPPGAGDLTGLAKPPGAAGRIGPATDTDPTRVITTGRPPMASPTSPPSPDRNDAPDPYGRPAGGRGGAPNLPVVSGMGRGRGGGRTAGVVIGVVILLVALVGGVLGFVFLPAAKIVVTPKVEPISLSFDVRADPTVKTSDPANSVVPATVGTFPLNASAAFPATGKKITNTKATGSVTFASYDPARSNTIPAGSVVSTTSDVEFVTSNTVHLPPATLVSGGSGVTVVPSTGDSKITAVKGGTDGNVAAGTIRVVPSGENGVTTKVINNAATTGGTHTETLQVTQKDIDGATAALTMSLSDQLDAAVADPSQILPGLTVFPETKAMTGSSPSVDPTTLVSQLVDSFTYGLTAMGSVTAVDETAVQDVATTKLLANVGADHGLVKDSLKVSVGDGSVQDGVIVFPVKATASQIKNVVAADLIVLVRGKTAAEAKTALAPYGDVTIDLWPGISDRIPTFDFRIDLAVDQETPLESPGPSLPASTPRPTVRPTASPSPAKPSNPAKPSTGPSAGASTDAESPSPSQ